MGAPPVRFARIRSADRRYAFYCAVRADGWDRFITAYESEEDLVVEPFEFNDAAIVEATGDWIANKSHTSDRPVMVMVGSTEYGRWVNWNLSVPPPVD